MAVQDTMMPIPSKQAWIEPDMQQLHIEETAAASNVGGDGQTAYSDCTKS